MVSEKPMVYGKIIRETKYLALIMIEVSSMDIMIDIIVDKEKKAILGVGLSRRQVFEVARANAGKKMMEKLEDLDLQ